MTITATGTAEALDVAGDLRALGLPRNGIYLVHSSLRRVGPLAEGPRTLVDGLRETCGPRSTVLAPTFTAGNSTTTRAYLRRTAHMDREQRRAEEDRIAGFDRRTSPSQNVGAIPEYIRTASGSTRSNHPQTSFSAIGPRAAELLAVHELECHLGDDSPLGRLYDNDAVVLLSASGSTSAPASTSPSTGSTRLRRNARTARSSWPEGVASRLTSTHPTRRTVISR